jgi:hypothetical protein
MTDPHDASRASAKQLLKEDHREILTDTTEALEIVEKSLIDKLESIGKDENHIVRMEMNTKQMLAIATLAALAMEYVQEVDRLDAPPTVKPTLDAYQKTHKAACHFLENPLLYTTAADALTKVQEVIQQGGVPVIADMELSAVGQAACIGMEAVDDCARTILKTNVGTDDPDLIMDMWNRRN